MELHQLRYFVAVAEQGNFSRAAERVHVAQPSLSQQILNLEAELGQPLFHRQGRKAVLTDAGEILLQRARRILLEVDNARTEIIEQTNGGVGTLKVGAIPTVAPFFLPPRLHRFLREQTEIRVHVLEGFTANLLEKLDQGELDVALLSTPITHERIETLSLFAEPFCLVLPRNHRLAHRKKRPEFPELEHEAFICLSETHCLGGQIHAACANNAFTPRVRLQALQIETILQFVRIEEGVSILPRMTQPASPAGIVFRELAGVGLERNIAVAWHKQRFQSIGSKRFIEFLRTSPSPEP